MEAYEATASTYNYYPLTAVHLSSIAYEPQERIPDLVGALGLEVVWGPAEWDKDFIPYSLLFVAKRPQTVSTGW